MNARVVELVDTTDLKSVSPNGECGFEPRPGYIINPQTWGRWNQAWFM